MNSNQMLGTLYKKYYSGGGFSEVTSSHWREFGVKTTVTRNNHDFEINSYGISTHTKKSPLRSLKHLPIDFLLSGLLRKHNASEKTIAYAKSITSQSNIIFAFDHAKHVLIYDLIESYGLFNTQDLICIIGDGHGFFGTLIKAILPDAKILFINLGRNLLIDAICFSKVFPGVQPLHLQKPEDRKFMDNHSIYFLEAEQFDLMKKLPISLFVNIASMAEMEMPVIQKYFIYMRTSIAIPHFYCCNREEKTLPDGSIIRFSDYPWEGAEIIVDELCPWYQQYPSSRPPFWHPFDGPIHHRLVRLERTLNL